MSFKTTIFFLLAVACISFTLPANATVDAELGEVTDTTTNSGQTTYEMICEIRQMFCGAGAIAVVSFVVITIGFLILRGKISWGFVLVLLTGVFIFVGASEITRIMTSPPPGLGVVSACEC